jgi:integrase
MARPVQPIGTYGTIAVTKVRPGVFCATGRFRAFDGGYIRFSAAAATEAAARRQLKQKIAEHVTEHSTGGITGRSPLAGVALIWLDEITAEARLAPQTIDGYEDTVRRILIPDLGKMRLNELTVGVVDRYLKGLAAGHVSRAKKAKVVLSQVLALAVRHDALRLNPVPQTAALPRTHREVRVLSPQQCGQIRHAIAQWRTGTVMGPKPDRQLEQLFDFMLGTGTRIGEALAIRRGDLDLTDPAAVTVTISGTLIFRRKLGIVRQDHPKQSKHWRIVTVPAFTAAALRQRLDVIGEGPQELVFQSRKGTALSPANVRRHWRAIRASFGTVPELTELATVVPHVFRKTAADTVDKTLNTQAAADLLGHSSTAITEEFYIRPIRTVNPATADALQKLAPQPRER